MAYIQSANENDITNGSYQQTLALTSVTAGSTIICATRVSHGSANEVVSVSSSIDGAFTSVTNVSDGTIRLQVWKLENVSAGTHTVTVTTGKASQTIRWLIAEYGGPVTVDDFDSASFTTTTAPATSSITTTGSDRTIVSILSTNSSATSIAPATGETERIELDARLQLQDEAAATAGNYSASWTLGATQPGTWAILALGSPATKYLKLLASSSAQSDTGVSGVVFDGTGYTTSDYLGTFSGKSFEASLESGNAVLKVPVADFGGSALTTSSTPVAFVWNSTDAGIGPADCTVIEE